MSKLAIYLRALVAFKLAGAAILMGGFSLLTGNVDAAFYWFCGCGLAGAFISPNAYDLQDVIRTFRESAE